MAGSLPSCRRPIDPGAPGAHGGGVGWASHTGTRPRRLPVLALAAALVVTGAGAGCGGGGAGSGSGGKTAGTAPSGAVRAEVPLAGGARLQVIGLPQDWVSLGSPPLPSAAP